MPLSSTCWAQLSALKLCHGPFAVFSSYPLPVHSFGWCSLWANACGLEKRSSTCRAQFSALKLCHGPPVRLFFFLSAAGALLWLVLAVGKRVRARSSGLFSSFLLPAHSFGWCSLWANECGPARSAAFLPFCCRRTPLVGARCGQTSAAWNSAGSEAFVAGRSLWTHSFTACTIPSHLSFRFLSAAGALLCLVLAVAKRARPTLSALYASRHAGPMRKIFALRCQISAHVISCASPWSGKSVCCLALRAGPGSGLALCSTALSLRRSDTHARTSRHLLGAQPVPRELASGARNAVASQPCRSRRLTPRRRCSAGKCTFAASALPSFRPPFLGRVAPTPAPLRCAFPARE